MTDPTHRHGYDEDDLMQWRMDQPGPATVLPGQLNLGDVHPAFAELGPMDEFGDCPWDEEDDGPCPVCGSPEDPQ